MNKGSDHWHEAEPHKVVSQSSLDPIGVGEEVLGELGIGVAVEEGQADVEDEAEEDQDQGSGMDE